MRILITAFEPYDVWRTNASWLTLVELTRQLPAEPDVTTRLYPVDFEEVRVRLTDDLARGYDYVLLTGQAPGRPRVELETVALNLAAHTADETHFRLVDDGPDAYTSGMRAHELCHQIRQAGVPAAVSCHAGTYLCNASLYLALHIIAQQAMATQAIFIHVPLDCSQAAPLSEPMASMPASLSAKALQMMIENLSQTAPPKQIT